MTIVKEIIAVSVDQRAEIAFRSSTTEANKECCCSTS